MSAGRHLVEPATDMLMAYIQANIGAALQDIITDRAGLTRDYGLATPVPKQYFIAKNYTALEPPSIFVVCDSVDFKKERGANFIIATAKYGISAIAEAQTTEWTTRTTWRYQAALSKVLDNLTLTATDNAFKITVIVRSANFSEDYENSTKAGGQAARWRKGVELKCDVEFYEQL